MNPFTIDINTLLNLTPEKAVELFRLLLWAESTRVGVRQRIVRTPQCIYDGDGGLDAIIDEDVTPSDDDLIPSGKSGFQIKRGDLKPGKCKKELIRGSSTPEQLKEEIGRLLNRGGTYILVLFTSLTDAKRRKRYEAIKAQLSQLNYPDASVRVYSAEDLQRFVNRFVSFVCWLNQFEGYGVPFWTWKEHSDIQDPPIPVFDASRNVLIQRIRESLNERSASFQPTRVIGLPGVGKTRLVFEALNEDGLREQVIYAHQDSGNCSSLSNWLQMHTSVNAIVVIDGCDPQLHAVLVKDLAKHWHRIKLITLSTNRISSTKDTVYEPVKPMTESQIEKLLNEQMESTSHIISRRIAQFSEGIPQVAVLLRHSFLRSDAVEGNSVFVEDEHLFNRMIGGESGEASEKFRTQKRLLTALSLFDKIGYGIDAQEESKWLASHFDIPWLTFQELISEQRKRGVIRGKNYLSVSPLILRIHLTKHWISTSCLSRADFEELVDAIPDNLKENLFKQFISIFAYAGASIEGLQLSKELLSNSGIFASTGLLDTFDGSRLFMKLSEANPEAALSCLEREIGFQPPDELRKFIEGRRNIVWALEMIIVWKELCSGGARLLMSLAEAENESCGNNATGIFSDLFVPAPGIMSSTEATPEERFTIIAEAIKSDSMEKRNLGLLACESALTTPPYTKMLGSESQGLRRIPQYWSPSSNKELYDAYARVLNLLMKLRETSDEDKKRKISKILLTKARGLCRVPDMPELVTASLELLAEDVAIDKKRLLQAISSIQMYEENYLTDLLQSRLAGLKTKIIDIDFHSRLERYAGFMLHEDWTHDDRGVTREKRLQSLATEAVDQPKLLDEHFKWLNSREPENSFGFGLALGRVDSKNLFLSRLIEELKDLKKEESTSFVGGYFSSLRVRDIELWESTLDNFMKDNHLKPLVPDITWRSGLSERSAERVLQVVKDGDVPPSSLAQFIMGSEFDKVEAATCQSWLDYLIELDTTLSLSTALILFHSYYVMKKRLDQVDPNFTLELLINPKMFGKQDESADVSMMNYRWTETALRFLEILPEHSAKIGSSLVSHFGESGTFFEGHDPNSSRVLLTIGKANPALLWSLVKGHIVPPVDEVGRELIHWLRGERAFIGSANDSILPLVPLEDIWQWIDEEPRRRAPFLAEYVPPVLESDSDAVSLPREILIRYGDDPNVHKSLFRNFYSEGWSGNASTHYRTKKEMLGRVREAETNKHILSWLNSYVTNLDAEIERALMEEERGYF